MSDFSTWTIDVFLDSLAARTPTPGGGGAAALAGAIGCAQARMVVAYSLGPKSEPGVRARLEAAAQELERCDRMLRSLMNEDAAAYERMSAVGKAARAGRGTDAEAATEEEYRAAVATAAAVPLEMAAVASTALTALDAVEQDTNRRLGSDAAVSATLLHACARAAAYSVRVNLAPLNDEPSRGQIADTLDEILAHCAKHAAHIESWAIQRA